jgi:hypothetical protein
MEIKTRGTTNILINCMKSVPKGANIAATGPSAMPAPIPMAMAKNIRKLKSLNSFFAVIKWVYQAFQIDQATKA